MFSLLIKLASKSRKIRKIPGKQEQEEDQSTNAMSIHPNNSHLFGRSSHYFLNLFHANSLIDLSTGSVRVRLETYS